jgi:hypothetical protein
MNPRRGRLFGANVHQGFFLDPQKLRDVTSVLF